MRLNSALTFIFLFVSAALSGPLREKDQSWVPNLVKKYTNGTSRANGVYYSDIYAGALWGANDGGFTFASATFNVTAQSGQHSYAVWVAIGGGIQHNDSWLFSGISTFVNNNSETTYKAWCYFGNLGAYFSNVTITPNDVIRTSITVLSPTSGAVVIENLNNGQADDHYFQVNSTQSLVEGEVAWGAGIYQVNDSIPFDTLTITNALAYGPSGKIYEAEGANKMEIKQDNKVVTSVETKGSTITIQHVHD